MTYCMITQLLDLSFLMKQVLAYRLVYLNLGIALILFHATHQYHIPTTMAIYSLGIHFFILIFFFYFFKEKEKKNKFRKFIIKQPNNVLIT